MNNDVTDEVNLYKKDFFQLDIQYRIHRISDYIKNETIDEHIAYGLPYAYSCLNDPNGYRRLIIENESNEIFVDEGLIQTYPADKAMKVFKDFCNKRLDGCLLKLNMNQCMIKHSKSHDFNIIDMADEYKETKRPKNKIWFRFPFYTDDDLKKFIGDLSDSMFICGYNYSTNHIYRVEVQPFSRHLAIIAVLFEAKYFEEDFKFSKYLYHVTTSAKVKKIKKSGLIPYNKSTKFDYPERVYLFNNAKQDIIFDYIETRLRGMDLTEAVVLKIDSDKLQNDNRYKTGKMKFYIDPMFKDIQNNAIALFTYGNISPKLIEKDALLVVLVDGKISRVKQIEI